MLRLSSAIATEARKWGVLRKGRHGIWILGGLFQVFGAKILQPRCKGLQVCSLPSGFEASPCLASGWKFLRFFLVFETRILLIRIDQLEGASAPESDQYRSQLNLITSLPHDVQPATRYLENTSRAL